LVLGGVRFDAEAGLQGHSDADVVSHAVSDAMLGAAGLGDLGAHFPDTDQRWAGADSLAILAQVVALVTQVGLRLANADCTVICETPRIGDAREIMMERLSAAADGPVHVKATRPEGLGSLGRVEGIACLAVALLEEIG
jgi:2-C-methyl-D-erythritol 2,4-cyclodiphosphate synthase